MLFSTTRGHGSLFIYPRSRSSSGFVQLGIHRERVRNEGLQPKPRAHRGLRRARALPSFGRRHLERGSDRAREAVRVGGGDQQYLGRGVKVKGEGSELKR